MRVRFAPSPTGALHIGGARTALYNWLLAHRRDGDDPAHPRAGTLVLRIEDTDRERSTPENVEQILDALALAGARLGRGADLPDRPLRAPPRGARRAARRRPRVPLHRHRRGCPRLQGAPRRRPGIPRGAGGRGGDPPAGARRRRDGRRRRDPGPHELPERQPRRSGDRPRRRLGALQLRGRRRRSRRRDHPRRPRRGPPLQHPEAAAGVRGARAPSHRATPICRCCTGPTGASSPSATAPPRCRSCARRATCRRR